MIKSKTLRFVFLAVALMMLAIGAFAFSAHSTTHAAAPSASATTMPHVSILRHKGGDAFGQTAITVTHGAAFNFINRTNTAQTVTAHGKTVLIINAKSTGAYVFKKIGTFTYSLASNTAATLTVTVH